MADKKDTQPTTPPKLLRTDPDHGPGTGELGFEGTDSARPVSDATSRAECLSMVTWAVMVGRCGRSKQPTFPRRAPTWNAMLADSRPPRTCNSGIDRRPPLPEKRAAGTRQLVDTGTDKRYV